MEAHREILAQNGVDTDDIPAPDLCIVGDWLGPIGEGFATLRKMNYGQRPRTRGRGTSKEPRKKAGK